MCTSGPCGREPKPVRLDRYRRAVLVMQRPSGQVFLTLPTTAPTGSLELVAGVLAHHAARGDCIAAQRLLHADLHAPRDDRRLTTVRAEAGRIARNTPTPAVVSAALAMVDQHPHLSEGGCRALLHAAGLGEGTAGRSLTLGLATLYGLTQNCTESEQQQVRELARSARTAGAVPSSADWSPRQVRTLRLQRVVLAGGWAVQAEDQRSKLANAVTRFLAVRRSGTPEQLLAGAQKSLSGMPQRHLLPGVEGLGHWIKAQGWLRYRAGVVRPTVELPLTFVDGVLGPLLTAGPPARRVALIQALVVAGYTFGAARVAVQRAPYLASARVRPVG